MTSTYGLKSLPDAKTPVATKKEAEAAAQDAKRMMQGFNFPPGKEHLRIVTKDEAGE